VELVCLHERGERLRIAFAFRPVDEGNPHRHAPPQQQARTERYPVIKVATGTHVSPALGIFGEQVLFGLCKLSSFSLDLHGERLSFAVIAASAIRGG
jgi:hypothetical protein